ncbi:hypothetical protein [Halopelagius longus]|uniref:hypothetical protein n=1 Tax=Halopelagius longus TaxID=1236180 RepID=UPI0011134CCA|nr:hypothetical protein [Halopelagius longus]
MTDEDIVGYRWNTETSIEDFLLAHHPSSDRPAQVASPFKPVRLFDEHGVPVDHSKIRTLFRDLIEDRTDAEPLGTVELVNADDVIRVHWLNTPDRELLGELSADGLHTFALEIDRKAHDSSIIAWYLEVVPPATIEPIDPQEVSTYLFDNA